MNDQPDDELPDATQLSSRQLRLLRDFFHDIAQRAARDNNPAMTDWARAVVDLYAFQLNVHTRQRRQLERHIAEYRRERPHGSIRGDTSRHPPWS